MNRVLALFILVVLVAIVAGVVWVTTGGASPPVKAEVQRYLDGGNDEGTVLKCEENGDVYAGHDVYSCQIGLDTLEFQSQERLFIVTEGVFDGEWDVQELYG